MTCPHSLSALLTTLLCWSLWSDPLLAQDPGRGVRHKNQLLPEQVQEIQRFLDQHDELLMQGDLARLRDFYSEDFYSPDLGDTSREQLLERWKLLRKRYREFHLSTKMARLDNVEDYFVVSGCRPFVAEHFGESVGDDFCQALILHHQLEQYRIVSLFEIDHDKLGRLDDQKKTYTNEELGFTLHYPDRFLPVPHLCSAAKLDEIYFLSPPHHAWISISLVDPTLPLNLDDALQGDVPDLEKFGGSWVRPPEEFTDKEGFRGRFAQLRYRCGQLATYDDSSMGLLYLSPDDRLLFALRLHAPTAHFADCLPVLTDVARNLTLAGPQRELARQALRHASGWRRAGEDLLLTEASLRLRIPEGWQVEPLAGGDIRRLRMHRRDDPESLVLLRVYPPDQHSGHLAMLEDAEECLERQMQRHGHSLTSRVYDELKQLPAPAGRLSLQFGGDQSSGEFQEHQIVAFEPNGWHVQVQLMPGSTHSKLPQEWIDAVVAAIQWE